MISREKIGEFEECESLTTIFSDILYVFRLTEKAHT